MQCAPHRGSFRRFVRHPPPELLRSAPLGNVYPFRDGVITVLELEIAIWRKHPEALFALMRKNPIRDRVEYVLGTPEFPSGDAA